MVVIEMNPRVSRSSALASKATGFPIAKIAAKLAVGYTLDELRNDITRETPASFEPAIDYCVVKFPRWAFEKFPEADQTLTTQMKSVGEVMAIGRTFKEALQKAVRSLEQDRWGLALDRAVADLEALRQKIRVPNAERCFAVGGGLPARARHRGAPRALRHRSLVPRRTSARSWSSSRAITAAGLGDLVLLRRAKQMGFADRRIAELTGVHRGRGPAAPGSDAGIRPVYKMVDTCAAEFVAHTPYLYSTYEEEDEAPPTAREKVVILGSGPNRIGQGIEFDYACVHAAFALRRRAWRPSWSTATRRPSPPTTTPPTASTSSRSRFEDVMQYRGARAAARRDRPVRRADAAQAGGAAAAAGVPILGTPPDAIDRAEDRKRFAALLEKLGLAQAPGATARSLRRGRDASRRQSGFPVLVRPSYVPGRARHADRLRRRRSPALHDGGGAGEPGAPDPRGQVPRGRARRSTSTPSRTASAWWWAGSWSTWRRPACTRATPPAPCPRTRWATTRSSAIKRQTRALALELGVIGLLNIQFAIKNETVYVLEVNPRASRTRALRVQGHRRCRWPSTPPRSCWGGRLAEPGLRRGARGPAHRRQGGGASLHQVPRSGRAPGAGDEVHRRGHGHRPRLPQGLCEVADRGRVAPADLGQGLHLGEEPRQARRAAASPSGWPRWASSLVATAGTAKLAHAARA